MSKVKAKKWVIRKDLNSDREQAFLMRCGRRFRNSEADVGTLGAAAQLIRERGWVGAQGRGRAASAVRLISGECPCL